MVRRLAAAIALVLVQATAALAQTIQIPVVQAASIKQLVISYRATVKADVPPATTLVTSSASLSSMSFSPVGPVDASIGVFLPTYFMTSPLHFLWNGFLSMQNVVTVFNRDVTPMNVNAQMLDTDGNVLSTQNFQIQSHAEFDIPVNSLPGFSTHAIGSLRLDVDTPEFDGNGFFYRFARDGRNLEFMTGSAFEPSLNDVTFVAFNTIQPSRRASELENEVSNWLSISNLATDAAQILTLEFYGQAGNLIRTANVTVPPLGRRDVAAGHEDAGPRKVGLVKLIPSDAERPYTALLTRYGASAPIAPLAKFYHFAVQLPARRANAAFQYLPISRGGGGENWVMVANTSANAGEVQLNFKSNSGSGFASVPLFLPPFGQQHILANSVLAAGESGVVELASPSGTPFIAESSFYFYDSTGETTAAYAVTARRPFYSDPIGSYNSFLGQSDYLRVYNIGSSANSFVYGLHAANGTALGAVGQSADSQRGADLSLQSLPFFPGPDSYGLIFAGPTLAGTLMTDLLRFQTSLDGRRIQGIQAIPVR